VLGFVYDLRFEGKNEMKHACTRCDGNLEFGEKKVVQMLVGPWYDAITPAYTKLIAEWHPKCFEDEFLLNPQARPYLCEACGHEVLFGEAICFFVIGEETDEGSTVAEKRGDRIYTIKHHPNCPKSSL
jgi:hypothetical protein